MEWQHLTHQTYRRTQSLNRLVFNRTTMQAITSINRNLINRMQTQVDMAIILLAIQITITTTISINQMRSRSVSLKVSKHRTQVEQERTGTGPMLKRINSMEKVRCWLVHSKDRLILCHNYPSCKREIHLCLLNLEFH